MAPAAVLDGAFLSNLTPEAVVAAVAARLGSAEEVAS
jgi:hypothetical protein